MDSSADARTWSVWTRSRYVVEGVPLSEARRRRRRDELLVRDDYRSSSTDVDQAMRVAADELAHRAAEVIQRRGTNADFGSAYLVDETPMWWTFRRSSESLRAAGILPGAVSCVVDKLDLHVWTDAETEAYWAMCLDDRDAGVHRERVADAAGQVMSTHADALRRLGE